VARDQRGSDAGAQVGLVLEVLDAEDRIEAAQAQGELHVRERRQLAEGLLEQEARLAAAGAEARQELDSREQAHRRGVGVVAGVEAERVDEQRWPAPDAQR